MNDFDFKINKQKINECIEYKLSTLDHFSNSQQNLNNKIVANDESIITLGKDVEDNKGSDVIQLSQ